MNKAYCVFLEIILLLHIFYIIFLLRLLYGD